MSEVNPQPSLIALSACICGAAVDQEECPYPCGGTENETRAVWQVNCTDPNCGWQAIGWGADGARKAWNTRPQSRPEAELPELPDSVVEVFVSGDHMPQMREAMEDLYTPEQMRAYARAALQAAYGQQCAATRQTVEVSGLEACVQHGNSWLAVQVAGKRLVVTVPVAIASAVKRAATRPAEVGGDGWISVEDRLPNDDERVLAFGNTGFGGSPQKGLVWFRKSTGKFDYEGVTHWQSFPPAPGSEVRP